MKALIFETPNKPIIADVPMPSISDTEVLVKTRTVGICHSDYELLAGRYIIPISYPVTPGHEWCGEIVEVGKAVKNYKVGDRVVGECVVRTPERLHHFGFSMDGADREFFNVNPDWLHKLPDSVDDLRGSLIEPFTCGFYAVLRSGGTNASETVVVSGGGTIGLVTAAAALGMGARVIVADPIPRRREIANKLGAEAIDPTNNGAEQIKELTKGKGADLVIECAGHDASLAAVSARTAACRWWVSISAKRSPPTWA
jgi:L-iditol 2-dehydrogenase